MRALINQEIAEKFTAATGIATIPLKPYNLLDSPVACHADMLFCIIDNKLFCYEDYVKENGYTEALIDSGYDIIFVSHKCEKNYPYDIGLNVLVMGNHLFCNAKYTAKEIIDYANQNNYTVVSVKQGYSACSTLVINNNLAVTTDASIAKAIEKSGKRALLISAEGIILNGYNCGFIGGASCFFQDKVFVFGDISALKCGEVLLDLFDQNNLSVFPILTGGVYDFGGIKLI